VGTEVGLAGLVVDHAEVTEGAGEVALVAVSEDQEVVLLVEGSAVVPAELLVVALTEAQEVALAVADAD
jgi:hypothetical protein